MQLAVSRSLTEWAKGLVGAFTFVLALPFLLAALPFILIYRRFRPWQGLETSPVEVAQTIDDFVEGRGGAWDWDDFISVPLKDPELNAIRERCLHMPSEFPPREPNEYCNAEGLEILRRLAAELRGRAA